MLLAIQDVWTRRGPIRKMYSDNGGNFIGSARIITANHLQQLAIEKRLEWHFNPAWTPHWGGAWERLIREMKRAMKVVMKGRVIKEKVFDCVLLQTEDLLNSRPLTNVPVSPDDLIPLTPNYLIKLHPGYAFVQNVQDDENENPNLFIKRAKKISDKLISRWIKEYLATIADPKLKGPNKRGLEVDDYVIYLDPLLKPENWKRGRVIEVFRGRDGFARVANIKLKNGEILEKRSVARLAKLEIDDKNFTTESCLLLKIAERTLGQDQVQVQSQNKKFSFRHKKLIEFCAAMGSKVQISTVAVIKLWNELGQSIFCSREEIGEGKSGNALSIRELLGDDMFLDTENVRTIKINRIPCETNFMELLTRMAKLNWTVTRVAVDSIDQKEGFFAYITFEKESEKIAAIERKVIDIAGKKCKVSVPKKSFDILKRAGKEYAFIFWNHLRSHNCAIVLCRQKDTITRENALPRFSGEQLKEYIEYMNCIDMAFGNVASDNSKMHLREEIAADERRSRKKSPERRTIILPKGSSIKEK
ncbi:hypothetical protein PVAND_017826 [Polypedilum vanderplanki]|uniref:Integrase catalytic domain-containing protein n=1 Tax=Polypedilum vanderplanki TaxID=319348 RepID=A0A9J6B8Y8_POLVA|nr:hypothetical protein PVAND_017826 [Polypedilum vanderplanki]